MSKVNRLGVSGLLIMIAATAPGLALARCLPDYIALDINVMVNKQIVWTGSGGHTSGLGWSTTAGKYTTSKGRAFQGRPSYWLGHIPCWAGPCLVSWTLAATALSLRGPRPRLRRLARRPGMVAGLAVILALTVEAMQCLRFLTTSGVMLGSSKGGWQMYGVVVLTSVSRLAGYTVAVSWIVLALIGHWPAELNPGGRLARTLGWCWIAMALSSELGIWCFALNY